MLLDVGGCCGVALATGNSSGVRVGGTNGCRSLADGRRDKIDGTMRRVLWRMEGYTPAGVCEGRENRFSFSISADCRRHLGTLSPVSYTRLCESQRYVLVQA